MTCAFAANLKMSNFNTTAVADNTLVTDALELTAVAFPFLCCTENLFTEQTFALRTECTIIDGFRLFYFTVRP